MIESNVTGKTHVQPIWLTGLRVILGLILAYKGISFISDTALLETLIQRSGVGVFTQNAKIFSFIVSYLSLLCGLFIASGLWTRIFSIIQIPILIIAVFMVNIKGLGEIGFEMVLSIITLILLILFAVKGSGTHSADEFFRTYHKAGSEDGQTERFFKS
ncbi:MAG: DoxX family membrane protein [Ginsengibacter sp.]